MRLVANQPISDHMDICTYSHISIASMIRSRIQLLLAFSFVKMKLLPQIRSKVTHINFFSLGEAPTFPYPQASAPHGLALQPRLRLPHFGCMEASPIKPNFDRECASAAGRQSCNSINYGWKCFHHHHEVRYIPNP